MQGRQGRRFEVVRVESSPQVAAVGKSQTGGANVVVLTGNTSPKQGRTIGIDVILTWRQAIIVRSSQAGERLLFRSDGTACHTVDSRSVES